MASTSLVLLYTTSDVIWAGQFVQVISLSDKMEDDITHEESLQRGFLQVSLHDCASSVDRINGFVDHINQRILGHFVRNCRAIMDVVIHVALELLFVEGENVAVVLK